MNEAATGRLCDAATEARRRTQPGFESITASLLGGFDLSEVSAKEVG